MSILKFFKKKKPESDFGLFEIKYNGGYLFGVTAESAQEAEMMVCEEIFHNQTIPGFPEIQQIQASEVKVKFGDISKSDLKTKGIWYP